MNTNPFDRLNLGYDGLFGPRTMFYHLQPVSSAKSLVEVLEVPVMGLGEHFQQKKFVEFGTVAVVLLGVVWTLWKLMGTGVRSIGGRKGNTCSKEE